MRKSTRPRRGTRNGVCRWETTVPSPLTQPPHKRPRDKRADPASTPARSDSNHATDDWWSQVKVSCSHISLPPGARITLDQSRPAPVVLHLDMAPPERCKRAIQSLSTWFATFSTPPRLRVEFDHCPEGPTPRHHMVNGAIASQIERASFKVVTDRDAVEILFHRPDPRWKNPPTTG